MPSSPQQVPPDATPTPKEVSFASIKTAGFPEDELKAWSEGYDKARGPHCDKYAAAWRALDAARRTRNRDS